MPRFFALVLALLCSAAALSAKTEWLHARSDHFEVFSSAGKGMTESLVKDLEDIHQVFGLIYAKQPRYKVRMLVIYCANDRDMKPFLRIFQGKPVDVAGFYIGPVDYPAIVIEDGWTGEGTRKVIYHEMGHAYLESVVPGIPLWFNEGLAQVFESVEVGKKAFSYGMADEEAAALLRTKGSIPLRDVLGTTHNSQNYNHGSKRDIFYAQSWAFVHMCFFGQDKSMKSKLLNYLSQEGREPNKVACMEQVFGAKLEDLDEELRRYIRSGSYRYFEPKFKDKPVAKVEFLPYQACELEAARNSVLLRVHKGTEYENAAVAAFRLLADTDNVTLCGMASLHAADMRDTGLAETLGDRAIELKSDHPKLFANKILAETTQMPRNVTYRMPEEVATRLRGLIDQGLELYPGNLELIEELAYVEAFAPKPRMDKLRYLEALSGVLKNRDEILVMLAYIRWHFNDAATAEKILGQLSPLRRRSGLAREIDAYLKQGKPWKKFL